MANHEGAAGASARRQHERRRARDEARLRQEWGRLGGLAVALTPERQSTRAWSTGASGEERVGRELERVASSRVRVAHDRRIRGTKANIDHLVVNGDGVWVIDAKKYKGRPSLRVDGGFFRPRVERLIVGSRDQTKLVDGVLWQIEKVREVVDVPVFGALCFVDADWPLIGGSFLVGGVEVLWPKRIASRVESAKGAVDVDRTWAAILAAFPSA